MTTHLLLVLRATPLRIFLVPLVDDGVVEIRVPAGALGHYGKTMEIGLPSIDHIELWDGKSTFSDGKRVHGGVTFRLGYLVRRRQEKGVAVLARVMARCRMVVHDLAYHNLFIRAGKDFA